MDSYLRCEISAGQFSNEAAVRGHDYANEEFSLFVSLERVRFSGQLGDNWTSGLLCVEVLDSRGGYSLVYLPGPTFGNGQTITVADSQLERSRGEAHCN